MDRRFRLAATYVALAVFAAVAAGQEPQGRLTIDAIFDPQTRVDFGGTPPTDLAWLDADSYVWTKREARGYAWLKVHAVSGQQSALFDTARMEAVLAMLPGVTREGAAALARSNELVLSPTRTAALLKITDDLYFYDFQVSRVARLTNVVGSEEEPTFSPDGRRVAFVRANNLYVVDIASQNERPLTTDGNAEVLNGKLDWLYQEEIYGRGRFRGYWWSPDSSRLAFLRLDERPVPEYTVVDHIPYRPALEVTDYPKAGDPNPIARLGVVGVAGGAPIWADESAYSAVEFLIVNVDWTKDSKQVVQSVQDREQTWLDLNLVDVSTGRQRRVLRETTKAWVNENGNPVWLEDGSFLWISERSGFRHVFQYRADGSLIRQITNGRWDVRALHGIDQVGGLLYFSSAERSPVSEDVYRIRIDGAGLTRISQAGGTHRATFNPSFTQYIDVWSDASTPQQVRLHRSDGRELRVIDGNPVRALSNYRLARPEFVKVEARDGFLMDAVMIKPPDFNPARRYPVYQFTYAGPAQSVARDQWGGSQYMFHQMLAQHGVIVWMLDNRSASGRGVESQWAVWGRLGELELQDLEDGISWLTQQPYVDASRIVLSGWSYGGFMTAYALTHSKSWAAGIVGAPVTDWRDYDSVYTEKYMKLPQNNVDGYRRTAPRFAADAIHGQMLLIHGTMDDNVHLQNSIQFAYELQKAGKPFELMVYPRSRHGITDARLNKHLRQLMFDFVMRTVGFVSR